MITPFLEKHEKAARLASAPMFDASMAAGLCPLFDAIDRITADDQD